MFAMAENTILRIFLYVDVPFCSTACNVTFWRVLYGCALASKCCIYATAPK